MHDLNYDLEKFVARDICFSLEEKLESSKKQTIPRIARYSSFIRSEYDVFKKLEAFHRMKNLQTFIALPIDV